MTPPRSIKEVIDEARLESQPWENLCWWGFIVGGVAAVVAIVVGALRGDAWIGATGAAPITLCGWLMHLVMKLRRENVSLRLLEVAFNNATTAGQSAEVLAKAFEYHFGDPKGKNNVAVAPEAGSSQGDR